MSDMFPQFDLSV